MRQVIFIILTKLVFTSFSQANHLHLAKVKMVQRNDNYIYVTINTPFQQLFNKLEYANKPNTLLQFANGSFNDMRLFRLALLDLFHEQLTVEVASKPLQYIKVKTLSEAQIKRVAKASVAKLHPNDKSPDRHKNSNNLYLRINIDGYTNLKIQPEQVETIFPKELGEVELSFSKKLACNTTLNTHQNNSGIA
jgi:hypothetical protein